MGRAQDTHGTRLPWLMQVDFLAKVAHPHILPLRGFCAEGGQQILVMDYMANGSLASWLRPATHSEGACRGALWVRLVHACCG